MNGSSSTSAAPFREIQPSRGAILGAIATPGVVGNIIAIFITIKIIRDQKLSPNIFVLSLAIIDLFGIVVTCFPTWLCYAFGQWTGGDEMCDFQGFMSLFCSLGSGGIATCMAVDRYLAVKAPFWHRRTVTVKIAKKISVGVYIGSAVISFLPILGFGSFVRNLTGTYCTVNWFASEIEDVAFSSFFATIGISLVLTVIFCNVKVVVKLCQRKAKVMALSGQGKRQELHRARTLEKQFSRMMVVISATFLTCWIPFMVRIICNMSRIWISLSADLQASRLLLLNLVLDPFTYVLTRQQFRHALRHYLLYFDPRKTFCSGRTLTVSGMRSSHLSSYLGNKFGVRRSERAGAVTATQSPVVFEKCKEVEAGVPSDDDKSVIGLKYTRKASNRTENEV